MLKSKFKIVLLFVLVFVFSSVSVFALEVPKDPVIKEVEAMKSKNMTDPSIFKIYLNDYLSDSAKVQKGGYKFKTKVYIYEGDKLILQPELKIYSTEVEIKTTQKIDLSKDYFVEVEFSTHDTAKHMMIDSKKSDRFKFNFGTDIKSSEGEATDTKDISKIYVKEPKIKSATFNEKKSSIDLKLEDYKNMFDEIENNGNFITEVLVFDRKLNVVHIDFKLEYTDYAINRTVQLPSALLTNDEVVVMARFASESKGTRVYSPYSNEVILKKKLNTVKYDPVYKPMHIAPDVRTYLFPNEAGMIEPERPITRGEVALAFYSLLSQTAKSENFSKQHNFKDEIPYRLNDQISTMSNMGVIKGYEDNTFRINNPITRAEFVAIAMKFYDDKITGNARFTDVKEGFWAKPYIERAVAIGIINGYDDGSFKPNNPITRAEVAKVVNRITGRVGQEYTNKNKFNDNLPTKWYYEEIKAAN